MHMRAYSSHTIKQLFEKNQLIIKDIFTCSNNDLTWGQVREYSFFAKTLFYFLSFNWQRQFIDWNSKKTNA